jgi:hypothetical protein
MSNILWKICYLCICVLLAFHITHTPGIAFLRLRIPWQGFQMYNFFFRSSLQLMLKFIFTIPIMNIFYDILINILFISNIYIYLIFIHPLLIWLPKILRNMNTTLWTLYWSLTCWYALFYIPLIHIIYIINEYLSNLTLLIILIIHYTFSIINITTRCLDLGTIKKS